METALICDAVVIRLNHLRRNHVSLYALDVRELRDLIVNCA